MKETNRLILSLMAIFLLLALNTSVVNASGFKIAAPKNVKASVSGTANAKVKWSKVSGAKKYTIYRATSKKGKYKKVGASKTTSFVNKDLTRGKTYFYKVVANGNSSNSKKSSYAKVKILTKKQVLKKIRNALKDKKWVKNNVKMKYNAFSSEMESKYKQTLYFGKLINKELVAIEAVAEDAYSVQMFIVGYKNGRVVASPQTKTPIHYYHGGPYIDLKNGIAGFGTLHMGYEYSQYYKVSNVKFTSLITFQNNAGAALEDDLFYEINGKKVSADKYNKEVKKYSKYDCSSLQIKGGHKLNDKNIDKYIK